MTRRALELAAKGVGRVSPSPLVGCAIVTSEGKVVGEGTYIFRDVTHAEVIALKQAGSRAKGATAYVSLEPHSHHGRTPPCTEALIEAGIRRVVCPVEDPNPLVSGQGFSRLREAGIEVVSGILRDEAVRLNEKFFCWHTKGRPFVHLKAAGSLDGKIATRTGDSKWITSKSSRSQGQELRYEYDAILVGAGTVAADDPSLTDRTGKPRDRQLLRVVLDTSLRTSVKSTIVSTAREFPTLFIAGNGAESRAAEYLSCGADVSLLDKGPHDIASVLQVLFERGITSVLVEGGSEVAGSFLDAGLVDKATFFIAPVIIGGSEAPEAVSGGGAETLAGAWRLREVTVSRSDEDIVVTGYPNQGGN